MAVKAEKLLGRTIERHKQIVAANVRYQRDVVKEWTRQELRDEIRDIFGKEAPALGTLANMESGKFLPEIKNLAMVAVALGCDLEKDLLAPQTKDVPQYVTSPAVAA